MKNTLLLGPGNVPREMAKGYDDKGRHMPIINWEALQVAASIAPTSSDMLIHGLPAQRRKPCG